MSAFCLSIVKGDMEIVQKLIDLGEDVNQTSNGMTPLMYAARFNRCEILNLLIANGTELKTKSTKGFTALKYAKLSNTEKATTILEQVLDKKKRKA